MAYSYLSKAELKQIKENQNRKLTIDDFPKYMKYSFYNNLRPCLENCNHCSKIIIDKKYSSIEKLSNDILNDFVKSHKLSIFEFNNALISSGFWIKTLDTNNQLINMYSGNSNSINLNTILVYILFHTLNNYEFKYDIEYKKEFIMKHNLLSEKLLLNKARLKEKHIDNNKKINYYFNFLIQNSVFNYLHSYFTNNDAKRFDGAYHLLYNKGDKNGSK